MTCGGVAYDMRLATWPVTYGLHTSAVLRRLVLDHVVDLRQRGFGLLQRPLHVLHFLLPLVAQVLLRVLAPAEHLGADSASFAHVDAADFDHIHRLLESLLVLLCALLGRILQRSALRYEIRKHALACEKA